MKKKILSLVLAICLIIPCVLMLSSCKLDTFYLHIRLNGGHYTESYKQANNYSSDNVIKVVNPKLYDKFSKNIAQRNDITPPEGKVFAGWYLNQECTPNYYFNKTNWNRVVEEKKTKESKSASIYAYWIDESDIALSFDLEGSGLEFAQSYKSELGINHNSPRFIGTPIEVMLENLPTVSDIIVPEDRTFNGWYLNEQKTLIFNETNLVSLIQSNADIRVYPKVVIKPEIGVTVFADTEATLLQGNQYSGNYYFIENPVFDVNPNFNYEIGFYVYNDEFEKANAYLTQIINNNLIAKSESVSDKEFAGWKIVQYVTGGINLIDFNETNWNNLVGNATSFSTIHITATWN